MGASLSNLTQEQIEELSRDSGFSDKEIKRLYKRFQRLDKNSSGDITADEFLSIPELAMNPLMMRVICAFDGDSTEHVNFRQFIKTLAIFRPETRIEAKLKFAFKIYDVNNEGFVTPNGLFKVMKMMVGTNLKDEQIREIADKTIKEADTDNDGKLSFEEFKVAVKDSGIENKLSIRF